MRVLFVSPYVPSRVRIRPYYWITGLARLDHEVTLVAPATGPQDIRALQEISRFCARVRTAPLARWRPVVNCLLALPRREPLQVAWTRLPALDRLIRDELDSGRYDLAHVEHLRGASFRSVLAGLPIVYDAVDSISRLFEQTAIAGARPRDRWMARADLARTRRFESALLDWADRVAVSSELDAARFRELSRTGSGGERIVVLPNPVDTDYFRPGPTNRDPATLVFSGKMSYHANFAAAADLIREIMPRVWRVAPQVSLRIVGQGAGRSLRRLAVDPRIQVVGGVPDLRPWLAQATLAVAPVRYGVGIQNKVLEAMASGLPVITSARAREALTAEAGRDLVAADSPDEFAQAIVRLLGDPETRVALAVRGRAYVERHHDRRVLTERLVGLYERAAADSPHARSAAGAV